MLAGEQTGVEPATQADKLHPTHREVHGSGRPTRALEERDIELVTGVRLRKPYQGALFGAFLSAAPPADHTHQRGLNHMVAPEKEHNEDHTENLGHRRRR